MLRSLAPGLLGGYAIDEHLAHRGGDVPPADHLAVVFTNREVSHRAHQRRLGVFNRLRGQRLVAGGSVVDPHLVVAHRAVRWPVVERRRRGGDGDQMRPVG